MKTVLRTQVKVAVASVVLLLGFGGMALAQAPYPQDQSAPSQVAGPQSIQAALGTAITYQGQIRRDTGPITGTCDFQFSLWDAAGSGSPPTGGNQIGATQTKAGVSVSSGLFTVPDLDFGGSAFAGDARWLQIAVKCGDDAAHTTLSRQAITAAPYALYALSASNNHDHWSQTWTGIGNGLTISSTGIGLTAKGDTYGVWGQTNSTSGMAVRGSANATSGSTFAVFGRNESASGVGVSGWATALNGQTRGVYGRDDSTAGIGVFGDASAETGYAYGVLGQTVSISGTAVRGTANASSGLTYGVRGRTNSTEGIGVQGWAAAITGTNYGVSGLSDSTDSGFGVYGRSKATNGYGVYGTAPTTGTVGVATGSGTTYGVYGRAVSLSGRGVYGNGGIGVYGQGLEGVYGTGYYGVHGYSSESVGTPYAVYGEATSPNGYGVYAEATGINGTGIYAIGGSSGHAADFQGNVILRSRSTGSTIMELGEGLDYAEGFDVSDKTDIVPGTVLVIDPDHPGELTTSSQPYDTRVAGIVAGAKGLNSGVRLGVDQFDYNVALAGRVYCNVDATETAVEPGDLLTTSSTPGYAMKALDYARAQGAILGKAMQPRAKGHKGLLLVLVTLQ